jgi:ribosomal protein L37AE/L43A
MKTNETSFSVPRCPKCGRLLQWKRRGKFWGCPRCDFNMPPDELEATRTAATLDTTKTNPFAVSKEVA